MRDGQALPTIESRAYGPDSTPEECAALRARVTLREDRIVVFRELPIASTFSEDVLFGEVQALTAHLDSYSILVDLSEAQRPSAEVRGHLKTLVATLQRLERTALFTNGNFVMNIVGQFVIAVLIQTPASIHRTFEEALEALHRGRR